MLNHDVYYIAYVTKKTEYDINSVNPLYLMINRINGHFEVKDGDKYLIISPKTVMQYKNIKKFLID